MEELFIAVVKNHEGKYFKEFAYTKGNVWVDELKNAKIFTKLSNARTRVTLISGSGSYPIPVIPQLIVTSFFDIDQTARIVKFREDKRKKEIEYEKQRTIWRKEQVQRDYDKAKAELDRLAKKLQPK